LQETDSVEQISRRRGIIKKTRDRHIKTYLVYRRNKKIIKHMENKRLVDRKG
jgi:hypothetical protein